MFPSFRLQLRLLLAVNLYHATHSDEPPKPPQGGKWNVLMIVLDDLPDWTGYLGGHPNASTPNIDRLARKSVAFKNAYTPSSQCLPARTAILYGLRPTTSGIYNNGVDWHSVLGKGPTKSLPQYFKDNNYETIGTGKIFHSIGSGNPGYTNDIWTNYYDPVDDQPRRRLDDEEEENNGKRKKCGFCTQFGPGTDPNVINDKLRVEWIQDHLQSNRYKNKPFFMAMGLKKPHKPWIVPNKYFKNLPLNKVVLPKTIPNDLDDIPPIGIELAENENQDIHGYILAGDLWEEAVQGQLATILFADEQVGRVLKTLENSQYGRNTIVVLWSDHGYHLGEKEHWKKGTMWEDSTHVPYTIRVPGLTNKGTLVEHPVDLMSIYPTLTALTGLPDPSRDGVVEGENLMDLLTDPKRQSWPYPAIMNYDENHAIRKEAFRYIQYRDGSEELYDHGSDIHEWYNMAGNAAFRSDLNRLRAMIPRSPARKIPLVDLNDYES